MGLAQIAEHPTKRAAAQVAHGSGACTLNALVHTCIITIAATPAIDTDKGGTTDTLALGLRGPGEEGGRKL